jgi:hypothetical protein
MQAALALSPEGSAMVVSHQDGSLHRFVLHTSTQAAGAAAAQQLPPGHAQLSPARDMVAHALTWVPGAVAAATSGGKVSTCCSMWMLTSGSRRGVCMPPHPAAAVRPVPAHTCRS